MVAMVSRPPTGTLATTWVTPATLQLCTALTLASVLGGAFLVATGSLGGRVPALVLGIVLLAFGARCVSVALVGFAQRRA